MVQTLQSAPPNGGSSHAEWIAGRTKVLLTHYFQPDIDAEVEEAALGDWIDALIPFSREAIEHATRSYIRDQPRRRPTPGDIRARAAVSSSKDRSADRSKGNRDDLTHDEIVLLDEDVLPRARHWVREMPGLAEHGAKTLDFWGEQIPTPNVLPRRRRDELEGFA